MSRGGALGLHILNVLALDLITHRLKGLEENNTDLSLC